MPAKLEPRLVAIGCNACTHAVSWSSSGEIAYAAGRTVALYTPSRPFGVEQTLLGHRGQVTAVQWIDRDTLVTGSTDATLRLWRRHAKSENGRDKWSSQAIEVHSKSVSCIVSCGSLVASSAMDGSICVFRYEEGGLSEVQRISFSPLIPLTLALANLPGSDSYVLAVGGTSTQIALYTTSGSSIDTLVFELKTKLVGHEDWIRSLDFLHDGQDLLLASGSQDRYIRIWRIIRARPTDKAASELSDTLANLSLLQNKAFPFTSGLDEAWEASFEALLVSHEDWVFSVQFSRTTTGVPCLLSASADSSVIIWQPDADADIWTVSAQLGIISSKGASTATGSTGGFWGAVFGGSTRDGGLPDASQICAWNRTGALRLWQHEGKSADSTFSRWQSVNAIGGHTKQVRSLSWSPGGEYLLTTSLDQTTRLWACNESSDSWHEFARPQIHGFDLQMVHALSPRRFLSGAEEKLVRVFEAPGSVLNLLNRVAGSNIEVGSDAAESANVPALGLSNKALGAKDLGSHLDRSALDASAANPEADQGTLPVSRQVLDNLPAAPLEDHLQRHTLFPEAEKLYGHGYEIQALTATHDGRIIVSGCRATTPDHACLRFYDATTYRQRAQVYGHTLTITQARFSSDDAFLLSVSRDRSLILYKRNDATDAGYQTAVTVKKAHKRIIWDCAWHPDNLTFATASRDATVALWHVEREGEALSIVRTESLALASAATAVAFSPDGRLAVGCEDGSMHVYTHAEAKTTLLLSEQCCDAAITAIGFHPQRPDELALCSEDGSVRIERLVIWPY